MNGQLLVVSGQLFPRPQEEARWQKRISKSFAFTSYRKC